MSDDEVFLRAELKNKLRREVFRFDFGDGCFRLNLALNFGFSRFYEFIAEWVEFIAKTRLTVSNLGLIFQHFLTFADVLNVQRRLLLHIT